MIRKLIALVAAVLAVAGVLCVVFPNRLAMQQAPVLPSVGDVAYYKVAFYDLDVRFLRVCCTKAAGKQRVLEVTYRKRADRHWKPGYTVSIDYQARHSDKRRVVVTDTHGRRVPRGSTVDGVPVPFHSLILVPGEVAPDRQTWFALDDGWHARAKGRGSNALLVPVRKPHYLCLDFQKDHQYYSDQCYWGGSDWLWNELHRASDTRDSGGFRLVRSEKPD